MSVNRPLTSVTRIVSAPSPPFTTMVVKLRAANGPHDGRALENLDLRRVAGQQSKRDDVVGGITRDGHAGA